MLGIKHYLKNKRGTTFAWQVIEVIIAAAAITEGAIGISEAGKAKPEMAALPNKNLSQSAAQEQQDASRRAILASGGQTDLTGGSGILLGNDIKSVSLGTM